MKRSLALSLLVVIVSLSCVLGHLTLKDTKENAPFYQWSKISTFPNGTVRIVYHDLQNKTTGNITCKLLSFPLDCRTAKQQIEDLENSDEKPDCVVVPVEKSLTVYEDWIVSHTQYLDVSFPVGLLSITPDTYNTIKNNEIQAQFFGWEPNEYFKFYYASVTVFALLAIGNFLVILFGLSRLYQKYLIDELMLNISCVCIVLETFACLFRFFHSIFELSLYINIYLPIPHRLDIFFYYISTPFTLSSGIFLIFLWLDITSETLYHGAFLDKLFYPAIIFVSISFVVLDVCAILAITDIQRTIINYILAFVLIFLLIIAVIYFIAAYKIYRYSKTRTDIRKNFKKMIYKILLSGSVMIVIVLVSFMTAFGATTLSVKLPFSYLTNTLFVLRSYLLIDIFYIGRRSSKRTGSETSNSTSMKGKDSSMMDTTSKGGSPNE